MKTPNFWKSKNIISILLYPFSLIYGLARKLHVLFSNEYKTDLNIICVGNITAGGSGKTPTCLKIGKILKNKNINFAFLSKGYKGKINNFTKVDIQKHNAEEVGDEPLLLAEFADTFVCKSRKKAIETLAKNYNYQVIIMDDGFQNPTIFKNKNIVIIDGEYGFGNGLLLPAGPLRESLKSAKKRASFFVIIGSDKNNIKKFLTTKEVIEAKIVEKDQPDINKNYIAFCGLGRPKKFFSSLKKSGYNVIKEISFEDHHKYTENEIKSMFFEAEENDAYLITTKKDLVKLPKEWKNKIKCLNIEIEFNDNNKFVGLILK